MRCSRPTTGASMSSFCTPFCSEMMPVSGPMTGRSARAAVSVSRSFTEKITISTLPMVFGSSVAFTLGRCSGFTPSSVMPFWRKASSCAPRAMNVTSAPPFCSIAP